MKQLSMRRIWFLTNIRKKLQKYTMNQSDVFF